MMSVSGPASEPASQQDGRELPATSGRRARLVAAILVTIVFAAVGAAWQVFGGAEKLAGFMVGLVFGSLVALAGRMITRRSARVGDAAMVRGVLLSTVISLVSFVAGTLAVGILWRPGVLPASLTALMAYFTWKGFEVAAAERSAARAANDRRKSE